MKLIKKLLKSILYIGLFFNMVIGTNIVKAVNNNFTSDKIPEEMQPYSEIVFTSVNTYKILKGGHVVTQSRIELEIPEDLQNANETYVIQEIINPIEGMRVLYGSDGLIFDIICPEEFDCITENVKTKSTRAAVLPGGAYLVATWGSYPNKLYFNPEDNEIIGVGRATTFSDAVGQGNRTMRKGDVATKLAYDNCRLGIPVIIVTKNSSGAYQTVTLPKWNAGGMPNAVLDIWKTGVEHWGYTWNSSFSMPYQVTFYHDNIDVDGNPLYTLD